LRTPAISTTGADAAARTTVAGAPVTGTATSEIRQLLP
jgi:hypothetical protein